MSTGTLKTIDFQLKTPDPKQEYRPFQYDEELFRSHVTKKLQLEIDSNIFKIVLQVRELSGVLMFGIQEPILKVPFNDIGLIQQIAQNQVSLTIATIVKTFSHTNETETPNSEFSINLSEIPTIKQNPRTDFDAGDCFKWCDHKAFVLELQNTSLALGARVEMTITDASLSEV